jgi:hypothetical protein
MKECESCGQSTCEKCQCTRIVALEAEVLALKGEREAAQKHSGKEWAHCVTCSVTRSRFLTWLIEYIDAPHDISDMALRDRIIEHAQKLASKETLEVQWNAERM